MAAQRRSSSPSGDRRPRSRAAITVPLVLLTVVALGSGAGYAAWHDARDGDSAAALDQAITTATAPPEDAAKPRTTPSAEPSASLPAATTSPSPPPKAGQPVIPVSGTGTFTTARADGAATGHGTTRRYKVQVEGGIELSSSAAAHEISVILADPRGWTADGHNGFQLVSSGPSDFVVKIATPNTVDAICGAAGLLTGGEVNCSVGPTVVVNLKRWMLGSPQFSGPIGEYRGLIINHEVGHRIGHGHEDCPGPGKLAPVMMQQIKGLHGCLANAWPYDRAGRYIQGPPVA